MIVPLMRLSMHHTKLTQKIFLCEHRQFLYETIECGSSCSVLLLKLVLFYDFLGPERGYFNIQ